MALFRSFSTPGIYKGTTAPGVPRNLNNTDVVAPDVKLYIEGVQVPFIAISINQVYGKRPSADIQIPPESGLIDIIRGYEPKVHIFYKDDNYGGDRLLFWGNIGSSNYSRSRQGQGTSSVSFRCEHKNAVLDQVTLEFTGWATSNSVSKVDDNPHQTNKMGTFNSQFMVISALEGLTGVATGDDLISRTNPKVSDARSSKLDPSLAKHEKRFMGLPAVAVNIWNQVKINCYRNTIMNMAMETMYIPLLEESLGFFKRMSGHLYLEKKVQACKSPFCHKVSGKEISILTPPSTRLPIMSAGQQQIAVSTIVNSIAFSGELTSFESLLHAFYGSMSYEIITLASPAEINSDPEVFIEDFSVAGVEKSTIETIIKPQLPFYYSPICNVILPNMYSSISINQEENGIPSRVTATYDAQAPANGSNGNTLNYRGPASIREAVSYNAFLQSGKSIQELSLASTKSYSYFIPGRYEQGRGIKSEITGFPWWLSVFASNKAASESATGNETVPAMGTQDYNDMMVMTVEWRNRNGILLRENDGNMSAADYPKKWRLNPYDPNNSDVQPHERLFFPTVDYEYSKKIMGSRSGVVEAAFNPYIIPGYPMDVIDASPNHPSFHGLCTSVTHTITSNSIGTSIGMAVATTYAELSNYYNPPTSPFLQTALNIANADIDKAVYDKSISGDTSPFSNPKSTLLQNPKAKAAADEFYRQVLGVGAAAPDDLVYLPSGQAFPVGRKAGAFIPLVAPQGGTLPASRGQDVKDSWGRSTVDFYSTVGNLRLVSRPIESKDSISSKFDYKFIDLDKNLYNNTYMNYRNPLLAANFYLEPGASMFLDYMETEDFITAARTN